MLRINWLAKKMFDSQGLLHAASQSGSDAQDTFRRMAETWKLRESAINLSLRCGRPSTFRTKAMSCWNLPGGPNSKPYKTLPTSLSKVNEISFLSHQLSGLPRAFFYSKSYPCETFSASIFSMYSTCSVPVKSNGRATFAKLRLMQQSSFLRYWISLL